MLSRWSKYFWLMLLISQTAILMSQPHCTIEHFSFDDGLNQSTIKYIFQDKKGFIWLGTYDGLIRYDGYQFKNFKIPIEQACIAKSNQVGRLLEDKYGRLWIISSDDIYCFNPGLQNFWGLCAIDSTYQKRFSRSNLQVNPSGKVWLETETEGCICIEDSLFNTSVYNTENKTLKSNKVNEVFEDSELNSWILTDKGICVIPKDNSTSVSYILKNNTSNSAKDIAVYSAFEIDSEIWFGANKGIIWRYSKETKSFYELSLNVESYVRNFRRLSDSTLFIQTLNDGFFTYNLNSGLLTPYNCATLNGLDSNTLKYVFVDYPNKLWFTTQKIGIYRYDFNNDSLKYYTVNVDDKTINRFNNPPFVLKDSSNNCWVHPQGGGFSFYDKETDKLLPFFNATEDPNSKFSNMVNGSCIDNQGNMWFSTRSNGLEKVIFDTNEFKRISISNSKTSFLANNVRAIYQEKNGHIWVATKEGSLVIYDADFNKLGNLSSDGELTEKGHWRDPIYCIIQDEANTIWLGSKGGGLYQLNPISNTLGYTVRNFKHNPNDIYSLSDNNVYSIFQDNKRQIWIGTLGGGINLFNNTENDGIRFLNTNNSLEKPANEKYNRVRCITQGKNGILYAGTSGGLITWHPEFPLPKDIRFTYNNANTSHPDSLSNNEIIDIISTKDGDLFMATFGGGITKVTSVNADGKPNKFRSFSTDKGLPSSLTLDLQEDTWGNIWATTENNLVSFNRETETFESYLGATELLRGSVFSEVSSCQLNSGKMAFGYSNGIVLFSPNQISTNSYKPKLSLLAFQVFNKPLLRTDGQPYNGTIDDISTIRLKHNQNFFTIEFTALDYTNPKKIQYAYILEGFDKEWNYSNNTRIANYTNIPNGDYTFRVKSSNSNGVWTDNEKQLTIIVEPSFWETPIAYVMYVILILLIIFLIQKNILTIYKLKSDVKLQKQMSDMKLKFFIDISHEIRTPLTMITAPIEYLINDTRTPDEIKKQLNFISQSTNRLLKLVNQILDFRRMQSKQLKVEETNIGTFIKTICADFMEIAEEKNINFKFENLPTDYTIWVDKDALEKIIMNLISNAFKYIKHGDTIAIDIIRNEKYTILKVTDNGPGIEKSKQKDLFMRFATFNDDKRQPSTGIGLSIVKEIADKHSAIINVESEPGLGTTFSVAFVNGYAHFDTDVELVLDEPAQEETQSPLISPLPALHHTVKAPNQNEKASILIIEDDKELRRFIKSILQHDYTIHEAENGAEGLEKALTLYPNFIVSDIMMPQMDGITFLKELRNNLEISHIPVILLTAKTNIESKLEGLTYGADDYITKPFSVAYFKARIENLIQQRQRLHAIFGSDQNFINTDTGINPNLITTKDEELMKDVINCITSNLDRNDFTVDELGKMLGISRSTFYNKIKSLTGLSPVEFIRDFRLKNAADLIGKNSFLIKEVCYMSGFSDTKYFGKCFKAKYGVTPMEYRTQIHKIDNE